MIKPHYAIYTGLISSQKYLHVSYNIIRILKHKKNNDEHREEINEHYMKLPYILYSVDTPPFSHHSSLAPITSVCSKDKFFYNKL